MLRKQVAMLILVLLALGLAFSYQVVWSQPAVDPAPPVTLTEMENPHGGFGPGTQLCLTCHSFRASQQALSNAL